MIPILSACWAQAQVPRLCLILATALLLATLPANGPAGAADDRAALRMYNEACRLSLAGDVPAALAAFHQALDLGFDFLATAETDPDLAALRQNPGFGDLITSRRMQLQLLAAERGQTLTAGQWTSWFELEPQGGQSTPDLAPQLRLRWVPEGLEFELNLAGGWAALAGENGSPPPWQGGPGLALTLAVPDETHPLVSNSYFLLAFGLDKTTPVGGLFTSLSGWHHVLELDPELRLDRQAGTAVMAGRVPWRACEPFHPLVDARLGFNAAVRVPESEGFRQAQLLPDPAAFSAAPLARRLVPLDFVQQSESQQMLVGKVSRSLSANQPLELTLAAVADQAGPGALALDFTDNQGRSVLGPAPLAGAVTLQPGLNHMTRQADFSALAPGLYTVRAELTFPSGQTAVWSTRVLHLDQQWRQDFGRRIAALPEGERRTGRYYLTTIEEAIENLAPRRDPGAIATTLSDLDRILTRAEATGTILPGSGAMLLVYPGPDGQDRLCTLYLPEGYADRGPVNPVLLLTDMKGLEPRMAQRLARWYETEGQLSPPQQTTPLSPVYVIPQTQGAAGNLEADVAEAAAALSWTREYFGVDRVALCGVDGKGGAALLLACRQPEQLRAVQIMAGGNLDPWPRATAAFLADQLQPAPVDLPLAWIDFVQETAGHGQGPALLDAIRRLGYLVTESAPVRGGLNFSQAVDHLVLWAEAMP